MSAYQAGWVCTIAVAEVSSTALIIHKALRNAAGVLEAALATIQLRQDSPFWG